MPSPFPDHIANVILDILFGPTTRGSNAAYTIPTDWYLALLTTLPTTTAVTGLTLIEPTAGEYAAYARQDILNTAANFPAAATRLKTNAHDIVFPSFAAGTGCTILGVALVDSLAGDGMVGWWSATPGSGYHLTADSTDPTVPAGALQIGVAA